MLSEVVYLDVQCCDPMTRGICPADSIWMYNFHDLEIDFWKTLRFLGKIAFIAISILDYNCTFFYLPCLIPNSQTLL